MKRTLTTLTLLLAGAAATPALAQSVLATPLSPEAPGAGWTRSDVRRYYPEPQRQYVAPRPRPILGWVTLRAGFFSGEDVSSDDFTTGLKSAWRISPEMQTGIVVDWHMKSDATRTVEYRTYNALGQPVTSWRAVYELRSDLVPLMGLVEFHLPSGALDPYLGASGGWEWLTVDAVDPYGFVYHAHYDGPGYQVYGGMNFPIAPRTKFNVEGFWNGATVKDEYFSVSTGQPVEERINMNGGGLRGGLSFAF
jgi:hypothetical protein